MDDQKILKNEAIAELKKILEVSFPHCKESTPETDDFIEINRLAHSCLKRLERLSVEKLV